MQRAQFNFESNSRCILLSFHVRRNNSPGFGLYTQNYFLFHTKTHPIWRRHSYICNECLRGCSIMVEWFHVFQNVGDCFLVMLIVWMVRQRTGNADCVVCNEIHLCTPTSNRKRHLLYCCIHTFCISCPILPLVLTQQDPGYVLGRKWTPSDDDPSGFISSDVPKIVTWSLSNYKLTGNHDLIATSVQWLWVFS